MAIFNSAELNPFFRLKVEGGFAESATHITKAGVESSSFPIILDEVNLKGNVLDGGEVDEDSINATVKTSDTTGWTVEHHGNRGSRDKLTINSVEYGLLTLQDDGQGSTLVTMEREIRLKV